MSERINKITQGTLIPLALVVAMIGVAWGLATDRAKALTVIEQHEKRIATIETKIDGMIESQRRIEVKLGTLPHVP